MTAGPTTNGADFNYFYKAIVSSATFSSVPQVIIAFRGQEGLTMSNEGTGVIEYSFNGNSLAGDMTPGEASENLKFDSRRVSKIWFRLKSGAPSVVRVEAWAAK